VSYLRALHEAHKARLRRLAVAATVSSKTAGPEHRKDIETFRAMGSVASAKLQSPSKSQPPRNPTIFEIKALVAKSYGISTTASPRSRYVLAIVTIRRRSMPTGKHSFAANRILPSTPSFASSNAV
jgi:hypothetical protein